MNKEKRSSMEETISPNGVYIDINSGEECTITGSNGNYEIEIDGEKMPFEGFTL